MIISGVTNRGGAKGALAPERSRREGAKQPHQKYSMTNELYEQKAV